MFEVNSSTITNSSLVDTALNLSPATNAVLLTANIIIVTTGILGNAIILFGSLRGKGGVPWVQIMENEFEYLADRGGHGGHLGEKFVKKYCS